MKGDYTMKNRLSKSDAEALWERCTIAGYLAELLNRLDQAAYSADLEEMNRRLAELRGYLTALAHFKHLSLKQVNDFGRLIDAAKKPFGVYGKQYWDQHAAHIVGN